MLSLTTQKELSITMEPLTLISTTFENTSDAERIASLLLGQKIIACAQVSSPITSIYRWEGKVATEIEYTLTVKTIISLIEKVKQLIISEHPYDIPEIIVITPSDVHSDYLEWLNKEVLP